MVVITRPLPGVALAPGINSNTQIDIDTPNLFGANEGGVLSATVAAA